MDRTKKMDVDKHFETGGDDDKIWVEEEEEEVVEVYKGGNDDPMPRSVGVGLTEEMPPEPFTLTFPPRDPSTCRPPAGGGQVTTMRRLQCIKRSRIAAGRRKRRPGSSRKEEKDGRGGGGGRWEDSLKVNWRGRREGDRGNRHR